jgi:hypothetical protein
MEIKYAIVSSDENPLYRDFWPIVRDLWSNHIGIKPVFLFITNKDEVIDHGEYIVHKVKSIEGVGTGLQSQIIRMYATKFYPNDVCITSDIDMLPLGKSYFKSICNEYDDDNIIILSSDAYPNKVRYPICYNVGKGSTFNEVLDLNCSFEEYVKRLTSFNWGWDTDELYFGKRINEFGNQDRVIKLNRGWSQGIANKRIDRVRWGYVKDVLQKGEYIDSHSLRPYIQHKRHIGKLISDLNGN